MYVQAVIVLQSKRQLRDEELIVRSTFRHKNGSTIELDGVGQAWQLGRFVVEHKCRRDRIVHLNALAEKLAWTQWHTGYSIFYGLFFQSSFRVVPA